MFKSSNSITTMHLMKAADKKNKPEHSKSALRKKVSISRIRTRTMREAHSEARAGQSARRAKVQRESMAKGNKIMSTMRHMEPHYEDVDRYGMDVGGFSNSKSIRKGI